MDGQPCRVCGSEAHANGECTTESRLTRERLEGLTDLRIEVKANFGSVLQQLRVITGVDLKPRGGGFHVTIIGPNDYDKLKIMTNEQMKQLQDLNEQIRRGEGVKVNGIGFIDGQDTEYAMRASDKDKKVAFVALEIPALQVFRTELGLEPKDFHITLGFVGNDIHFQVIGQEPVAPGSPKKKDITKPIPKKADSKFDSIDLPPLQFGGFIGNPKEQKKEKPTETKSVEPEVTKVEIPPALTTLEVVLGDKMPGVVGIYRKLLSNKDKPVILKNIVDGVLKNKLGLTDEQVRKVLATLPL